jgi:hypothetical protein
MLLRGMKRLRNVLPRKEISDLSHHNTRFFQALSVIPIHFSETGTPAQYWPRVTQIRLQGPVHTGIAFIQFVSSRSILRINFLKNKNLIFRHDMFQRYR